MVLSLLVSTSACQATDSDGALMVGAASSLRHVMPSLLEEYQRDPNRPSITVAYGASGTVCSQIEAGAPADLVVLAAQDSMERLAVDGIIARENIRRVATNRMALVVPSGSAVTDLRFQSLSQLPKGFRLAIGDPRHVPAGRYAQDLLSQLGHWEHTRNHLVVGGNAAMVLAYVRRGEVDAAIVYTTDVKGVDITIVDEASHVGAFIPEVLSAPLKEARRDAVAFHHFLRSPEAQAIFRRHGFGAP